MKRILIVAIALISIQSFAQQERKERPGKADKMARMDNFTAEEIATLKTKKMVLALDLNQAQQDKIYKLNLENAKSHKAKMTELKAKKESGDVEKPSKEERYKMANERLDRQIAHKAEMKNILTDEQYDTWVANQDKMSKKAKRMKAGKRKGNNKGKRS